MADLQISIEDLDFRASDFEPIVAVIVQRMRQDIERRLTQDIKASDEFKRLQFLKDQVDELKAERAQLNREVQGLRLEAASIVDPSRPLEASDGG